MKVEIQATNTTKAQTLISFVQNKKGKLHSFSSKEDAKNLLKDEDSFSGKEKELIFFRNQLLSEDFQNILFVGVGEKPTAETFRKAAAYALKRLQAEKVKAAALVLDGLPAFSAQTLAEGFVLSSYAFDDYKKAPEKKPKATVVDFLCSNKTAAKSATKNIEIGKTLAEATNFSRWLGDNPGNKMTPTILGQETIKAAKGTKLKVTAWTKAQIEKKKMGGLLGVAKGSSEDPRLIVMEYKGAAASKKPLCFVGKGLTFDSGGISIKPGPGMQEMKYDMCGGANVIGAMLAIAR